jgi:hypothetical protein
MLTNTAEIGALAVNRHMGESVLGSVTKSFAVGDDKGTSKARNQRINVGIVDDGRGHGRQTPFVGSLCRLGLFSLLQG